jgi:hypothetical protein
MRKILSLFGPLFFFCFLAALNISCQKVVNIDLNSVAPRVVIEANIDNQTGDCTANLSETVNFDQDNVFPPVSGASISLNNELGKSGALVETFPGYYQTSVVARPGSYTLTVDINGKNYVATSVMPPPVPLDSLSIENISFGFDTRQCVVAHFKDPAGVSNYYHIVEYTLNTQTFNDFAIDDRALDGTNMNIILLKEKDTLIAGETIEVDLQSVDKNVYDYFVALYQVVGGNGPQTASPTNPPSNFSGGALGYFSAYSWTSRQIVVPSSTASPDRQSNSRIITPLHAHQQSTSARASALW